LIPVDAALRWIEKNHPARPLGKATSRTTGSGDGVKRKRFLKPGVR